MSTPYALIMIWKAGLSLELLDSSEFQNEKRSQTMACSSPLLTSSLFTPDFVMNHKGLCTHAHKHSRPHLTNPSIQTVNTTTTRPQVYTEYPSDTVHTQRKTHVSLGGKAGAFGQRIAGSWYPEVQNWSMALNR